MKLHFCSHTLLPLHQSPPLAPPSSWIWDCHPIHYSQAGISVVMCANTRRKKGECRSELESQLRHASVCACESLSNRRSWRTQRRCTLADVATCTTAEAAATLFPSEPSEHSAGAFRSLRAGLAHDIHWDAWKRCLLRTDWWEPALRCGGWPPCVCISAARGELDAWCFHDDYNGLQSVHFTEARGTLQAAVWDCTGEKKHRRLWHWLCVIHCACPVQKILLLLLNFSFQKERCCVWGIRMKRGMKED